MPVIEVTPFYVALIALLAMTLSVMTGLARGRHNVALGDGGKPDMLLAMRRFGNLVEYAPLALLVLLMLELRGLPPGWLHAYGATLLALRILHPAILYGAGGATTARRTGRIAAAAGTALLIAAGAVTLLIG